MSEGFIPDEIPVRRGRRDPELARQLRAAGEVVRVDADLVVDDQASEGPENAEAVYEYTGLAEGDTMAAKITTEIMIGDERAWVSVGAQTRVLEGEDSEATFIRLGDTVNENVLRLANAHAEAIQELEAVAPPAEPTPPGRIVRRR